MNLLDLLITLAAAAAAAGGVVFLVRYPIRTGGAWRDHAWGVHVMLFTAALVLLELQPVAFRLFGDWPYREQLLLVLMLVLVAAHWHRVFLNEVDLRPRPRHVLYRKVIKLTTDQTPDTSAPAPPSRRPRPVLLLAALIAGLNAAAGAGVLADVLPARAVGYVLLASIVLTAVGGVLVQGAVTPLADPRNAAGQQLLPVAALQGPVRSAARAGAIAGAADVLQAAGVTPDVVVDTPSGPPIDPVDEHAAAAVREPAPRPNPFDDDWPGQIAR